MNRSETFDELRRSPKVDVCVIGGGINGISTFRELALQGVRVLLIDNQDYCSGASSALSRMVHGGLRYLENGEFSLVKEALIERDRLLLNAPHYVAPLPTVIPIFDRFSGIGNGLLRFLGQSRKPSRRGALPVKIGLSIYDRFTRSRQQMPGHVFRGRKETLEQWPDINPAVKYSATYYDASVSHPERLGIELLMEAKTTCANAMALNYADAHLVGAGVYKIRDLLSEEYVEIKPRIIINATGGWIDSANSALLPRDETPTKLVGGTKGSHLVIANEALKKALNGNMIYYENEDGRICILFPYLDHVLLGSTDIRVDDPTDIRCEADERTYMLQSLKHVLPCITIAPSQVIFQFSGVRPLPLSDDRFTGRIPRDHFCKLLEGNEDHPPVLCLIGGKWTTFRSFGELAANEVLAYLGVERLTDTKARAIGGGRAYPASPNQWIEEQANKSGITSQQMAHLFARYGTGALNIAQTIDAATDRSLAPPADDYSIQEIQYLCQHEDVQTLSDLLVRRTTIAINGRLSHGVIDDCLTILAAIKNWDLQTIEHEKQAFIALMAQRHGVTFDGGATPQDNTGASYVQ